MPPRTDSTEVFSSSGKIRCGLVHDHVLLRQGLRRLLEDVPDIEVVSEAGNAAECLRKVHELRPDVVVADSATFGLPAAAAEVLVERESPHTKIVFLSVHGADFRGGTCGDGPEGVLPDSNKLFGSANQAAIRSAPQHYSPKNAPSPHVNGKS